MNQLTAPLGYDDNDASLFGGSLILVGLFMAGLVGAALDRWHKYNLILKSGYVFALLCEIGLCLALRPNNLVVLTLMFVLTGIAMMPILPCALECGVECTFPIS